MTYIKAENRAWKGGYFEAELPVGWTKFNMFGSQLYLSKDGFKLQMISLSQSRTNAELPVTKKRIKEGMLLQEIAEIVIDEATLSQEHKDFKIVSNAPTKIGGFDAFRLEYTFVNDHFVKYRSILYGFVYKKKYYEVQYSATQQHYWDDGFKDFEVFVESFKQRV
jgi:hypothetical protein